MERLPEITMLVGLPGSGKSELAKYFVNEKHIHSSDKIREELFGDENDQNHNNEVFNELHKRIKEDLNNGIDCVYDATNISGKFRMAFLQELKNIPCCKNCIIVLAPYEECIVRCKNRERKVPAEVVQRMYLNFQPPYYHEGWDSISIYISCDDSFMATYNIYELYKKMNKFDQKNSHHTLTLGDHCKKCAEYIHNNYPHDTLVYDAAVIHDVGKLTTQTKLNSKGEFDGNYHYYQHHCTGAYDSLLIMMALDYDDSDILYISNLIYYHMHPFMSWRDSEKAKEKTHRLIGDQMFNDIIHLHEGDLYAH